MKKIIFCSATAFMAAMSARSMTWQEARRDVAAMPGLLRYWTFDEDSWEEVANHAPVFPGKRAVTGGPLGSLTISHETAYGQSFPDCYVPRATNSFPTVRTSGRVPGKTALAVGNFQHGLWRSGISGEEFTNGFSFTGWVRLHGSYPTNGYPSARIMSLSDGWGSGFIISASNAPWEKDGALHARFAYKKPSGETERFGWNVNGFPVDMWHHFAYTWDKSMLRLYVDGKCIGATNGLSSAIIPIKPADTWTGTRLFFEECVLGRFRLGGDVKSTRYIDFDEIAIFDHAVNADELRTLMALSASGTAEEQIADARRVSAARARAAEIRLGIPTENGGYFRIGEKIPVTLEVPAACDGPDLAGAKLSIHVETLDGCVLDDVALPVENGRARHEVSLPRCGCYYIDTVLRDGAGNVVKRPFEPFCVGVVPPKPESVDSPFGLWATEDRFCHDANLRRIFTYMSDEDLGKPAEEQFITKHFYYAHNIFLERQHVPRKDLREFMIVPMAVDKNTRKPFTPERMDMQRKKVARALEIAKEAGIREFEISSEINGSLSPEGYMQQLKMIAPMIRAAIPDALIYPPGATPNAVPYINKLLDLGATDMLDGVSIHPYCGNPIYDYHWHSIGKSLQKIIDAHPRKDGRCLKMYNTEAGISMLQRVKGRPMTSAEADQTLLPVVRRDGFVGYMTSIIEYPEAEAAAIQMHAVLMDLVTGFEMYVKCQHSMRGGLPSLQSVALTTLSGQIINHMKGRPRLLESPSLVSAAVRIDRKDGLNVLAVFGYKDEMLTFRASPGATFRTMDMYGNEGSLKVAPDGLLSLRAALEPIYIFNVPDDLAIISMVRVELPETLPEKGAMEGSVKLANPLTTALRGRLSVEPLRGAEIALSETSVALAPGASREVAFSLKASGLKKRAYSVKVSLVGEDGRELAAATRLFQSAGLIHTALPIAEAPLDCDPGRWEKTSAMICDDLDSLCLGTPDLARSWIPQWRGKEDLSFTSKVAYTRGGGVRFLLDVTDNVYFPAPEGAEGQSYRYDGLELFVDSRTGKALGAPMDDGADQILVAPPVDLGESPAPCRIVYIRNATHAVDVQCVAKRTPKGYMIEGLITPNSRSELRILPGSRMLIDFLIDDADGNDKMRKAAMAVHGNMSDNANTTIWGRYELGL